MVRKQLYIRRDQDKRLKQVAERTGVAEAEYVRMALDRALAEPTEPGPPPRDLSAWEEILAFLKARHAKGPLPGTRDWKREDIYDRPYPGRNAR
ncbi:MAG: ribbon-helix-helix domain-containing protein [Gammaproteobacteria bacterium]